VAVCGLQVGWLLGLRVRAEGAERIGDVAGLVPRSREGQGPLGGGPSVPRAPGCQVRLAAARQGEGVVGQEVQRLVLSRRLLEERDCFGRPPPNVEVEPREGKM
jgi:hypothetical protein